MFKKTVYQHRYLFQTFQVYHFHANQQCYTCRVIGEMAEGDMNTSFIQEIHKGNIIFRHVNVELPENADLVSRFGPTSSSVMIGYSNETQFSCRKSDTTLV